MKYNLNYMMTCEAHIVDNLSYRTDVINRNKFRLVDVINVNTIGRFLIE